MPYASAEDIPSNVKKLSPHKQTVWRKAFNAAYSEYKGDESKAFGTAWAAANKASDAEPDDEDEGDVKVKLKIKMPVSAVRELGGIGSLLPDAEGPAQIEAEANARRGRGDKMLTKLGRKSMAGKVGKMGLKSIAGPLGYAGTGSYAGFGGYGDAEPRHRSNMGQFALHKNSTTAGDPHEISRAEVNQARSKRKRARDEYVAPPLVAMPDDNEDQKMPPGLPNTDRVRSIMLIRHGETPLNSDDTSVDRLRGWEDVPLNETGIEQARVTGEKLKGGPPDMLVSSNLSRAHDTAKIISDITKVPLTQSSRGLRPWDVGIYAGEKTSEALPVLTKYATERPNDPIPGGESFNDFGQRFTSCLSDLLQQNPGKLLGVVSHYRNERWLKAWAKAGYPADGSVDHDEFSSKGEPTGSCEVFMIPMWRLHSVAHGGQKA